MWKRLIPSSSLAKSCHNVVVGTLHASFNPEIRKLFYIRYYRNLAASDYKAIRISPQLFQKFVWGFPQMRKRMAGFYDEITCQEKTDAPAEDLKIVIS